MTSPPIEQDYILDADGRQVMTMIDLITAKMAKIQQEVSAIVNTANKGGKDFDKSLDLTVKRLQQTVGQIRTLATSTQQANPTIQALGANRTLARQTLEATKYARELNLATNAADALQAKIGKINQAVAARGRAGGFATVDQTDRLKRLEEASVALRRLDAQYEALEGKARRSRGVDLRPELTAVTDARSRLTSAAQDSRRTQLRPELNALTDAQAALAERIAQARRQEAQSLRTSFQAAKELAVADASSFKTATELDRERARSSQQIRNLRNELKTASDGERSALLSSLEIEKARGRQLAANAREVEAMARVEQGLNLKTNKVLIPTQMRADAKILGANTVSTGAQYERELALHRLSIAATDQERIAALRVLEVAEARVRAASALVREEEREAAAIARTVETARQLQNRTGRALAGSDAAQEAKQLGNRTALVGYQFDREQALARLRLSTSEAQKKTALDELNIINARIAATERLVAVEDAELRKLQQEGEIQRRNALATQNVLAGRNVASEIESVGLTQARAAAQQRVVDLQNRLMVAEEGEQKVLRDTLALEEKKLKLIQDQVNAQNRSREQEEKQAAAAQKNSIGARIGRAAFNTALYSGVAMVGFGALNELQQGIKYAIDFEDEMAKLQAIANATDTQLQELKGSILGVGENSRYSTIDLAKISQTLAQAGVSSGEMRSVLQSVTTLATASGSTPDEAVNLVTSALGAFQLQASESARVADLMTSALNRTKLTVQQTGQAIQYVGATAYEQNISLEQMLATVGAVAQAGIRSGSTIGTGFRQFLVDLSNPSKKLQEQLDLLKLSAADVDVSVQGLPRVLENLQKAGFGAGQAYAGLETRAAAFYLVAKNNTDIMADLQLGFAQSGAAATANERAMNSLSAQWQRFKNIFAEGFLESTDSTMVVLKNLITTISDRILEMRQNAEMLKNQREDPNASFMQRDRSGLVTDIARRTANLVFPTFDANAQINGGLGDYIKSLTEDSNNLTTASSRLATEVAKTTEKVDSQRGMVNELEKEMERLSVQKASLRANERQTGAETLTLTSKFEGLAVFLTNAGNKYDDLTQATQRYRLEQLKLLGLDLQSQNASLGNQTLDAKQQGQQIIAKIKGDQGLMSRLNPQTRAALERPALNANSSILADAGRFFMDPARGNDPAAARLFNDLVQKVGIVASNTTTMRVNDASLAQTQASRTQFGSYADTTLRELSAGVKQLASASGPEQARLGRELLKTAANLTAQTQSRLKLGQTDGNKRFLNNTISETNSLTQQIRATLTPTKDEVKDAERAEREAAKGPKATQADIDALASRLGLSLGSGQRTVAEQNALHAAGKTPATGATSGHSRAGGAARDFLGITSDAQGKAAEDAARAYFKDRGIDAYVKYESGRGRNNGTGRHLHVNLLPGARVKPKGEDNLEASERDTEIAIDKAGTALDQRGFNNSLRTIKNGTSQAVIDSTAKTLERLGGELERDAIAELGRQNVVNPADARYKERMAQVQEQKDQLLDQFNDAIVEGLVKTIEIQTRAATAAFELAMTPAKNAVARAQASVSGLDNFSLQNTVPDYVRTLAGQRVKKTDEDLQRARLANLPGEIRSNEATLAMGEQKMSTLTVDSDGYNKLNLSLQTLRATIAALKTEQDSLNISLNAGSQLPASIASSFDMAAEAYRATNLVVSDFETLVVQNMGGALDAVSGGLTDMFTSIMTGSQTALGAFGSFAKGMINYIQQIAAKAVAGKIFELLLNVGASLIGPKVSTGAPDLSGLNTGYNAASYGAIGLGRFNGGPIARKGGGRVENGSETRDSVNTNLAKGEWVVRKEAVDSVGNQYMANLNKYGAKAISNVQSMPALPAPARQETSVYVVSPEQQPSMGPNDVLVAIQSDILSGGETKKLIKYVAQGG